MRFATGRRLGAQEFSLVMLFFALVGCGIPLPSPFTKASSKNSLGLAGTNGYPYCTNGSNTGSGYGWDTSVTDPKGSHSCLVPAAGAKGANGYPYCTNGSNTGSGYGWDTSVTDPKGSHSCLVPATASQTAATSAAPVANSTSSVAQNKPGTYPLCTNGSNTGGGYGWDTSVTDPNGSHSCLVPTGTTASTTSTTTSGVCSVPAQATATTPIPGTQTVYAASGSLSQLPKLSLQASTLDLKAFVANVYGIYPQFAAIYEGELGMSKNQALAFMYADMSRESAANGWRINLETGQGGPGHAWGPFQAAVTNFTGGGYDSSIEDGTGLPIPNMSMFYDPATSTYAGMKRLADGILTALKSFGPGQPASRYLLGTLADHNTGHVESANSASWLADYGNETLRLMRGYLAGNNLTNTNVFYTTESANDFCK